MCKKRFFFRDILTKSDFFNSIKNINLNKSIIFVEMKFSYQNWKNFQNGSCQERFLKDILTKLDCFHIYIKYSFKYKYNISKYSVLEKESHPKF